MPRSARSRRCCARSASATSPSPSRSAADAAPAFCNGTVLVPWPNRVRDARWTYDGRVLQLDITEPARGNALHGLLQFTEHEVRERTDASVTLGAAGPAPARLAVPARLLGAVRAAAGRDRRHARSGQPRRRCPRPTRRARIRSCASATSRSSELALRRSPAASYFAVDDRLNPTGELARRRHPLRPARSRGSWATSSSTPRSAG